MLYLHCGWPRTGTTTLQTILDERRELLAAAGVEYPARWQSFWGARDRAHNGIFRRLRVDRRFPAEFARFLEARTSPGVLVSAEALTELLPWAEDRDALMRLLAAAREVMPVTCVWTLRRFDLFRCSLYLVLTSLGHPVPSPTEFLDDVPPRALFERMLEVEASVDASAYVKYESGGEHNAELLRAFGLPAETVAELELELASAPRLNPSIGHKQAVALLNLEAISRRAGVAVEKRALRSAFEEGFQFDGDFACAVVDDCTKRDLRERALEDAGALGFAPYLEFFGAEEREPRMPVPAAPVPVPLVPDVVDDEDLARLRDRLRAQVPARWSDASRWRGDGLHREVFFFPSSGTELYGSLYAAAEPSRPFGVVACGSWGVEADRSDPLVRSVAIGMAKLGGAGLVFHYPGYGDSYGDPSAVEPIDFCEAARDAVAEATRRRPEFTWILAGFMLGASVACLAQGTAGLDTLLLVQPALRPSAYFARFAEGTGPLAIGSGRIPSGAQRKSAMEVGSTPGFAYGYPVPANAARCDAEVVTALEAFDGRAVVIRHAKPEDLDPAAERFEQIVVPGAWRFGAQNHPRLAEASVEWLDRSTRETEP
jgi:hypothetical protein